MLNTATSGMAVYSPIHKRNFTDLNDNDLNWLQSTCIVLINNNCLPRLNKYWVLRVVFKIFYLDQVKDEELEQERKIEQAKKKIEQLNSQKPENKVSTKFLRIVIKKLKNELCIALGFTYFILDDLCQQFCCLHFI